MTGIEFIYFAFAMVMYGLLAGVFVSILKDWWI